MLVPLLLCLVAVEPAPLQQPRVVQQWKFDTPGQLHGWQPGNMKIVGVGPDGLRAEPTGSDPILTSPLLDLPASASQWVRVRLTCEKDGDGEFFFANTTKGPFGGFSAKKSVEVEYRAGPAADYDILPFWHTERRIVRIRVDPPNTGWFQIESIAILEEASPAIAGERHWELASAGAAADEGIAARQKQTVFRRRLAVPTAEVDFIGVRITTKAAGSGRVHYAVSAAPGVHTLTFPLRADGRPHTYNVAPGGKNPWEGELLYLAVEPLADGEGEARLRSVTLSAEPSGPTDLEVTHFGVVETLPRAGRPVLVSANIENLGGTPAEGLAATLEVPAGVRLLSPATVAVDRLPYALRRTVQWQVQADVPLEKTLALQLSGTGVRARAPLSVGAALQLAKADYVPAPHAVDTGPYEVGVYYFPGWSDAVRWSPVQSWPARRPALGWYREGSPEVADWHIKWMLEHGIRWIAFDWYWSQGSRHLEHALHDGFFKARYQDQMQFSLLYANHNPPGTTSVEDSLRLTQYWIDNYFRRPNYLRLDGKPVVFIFSPRRITEDVGHDNVRPMFARMDELCRRQGIAGIAMVACARGDARSLAALAEEGYAAVSGYNYVGIDARRQAEDAALLTSTTERVWREQAEFGKLPVIPALAGGWDARPWHGPGTRVYYPQFTPEVFRKHCQAAREFLDRRPGRKLCIAEAWNEFGEGSILEPHARFGFGFVDAIREQFATAGGDHIDLVPADVGLGPYEVAPVERRTAWEFAAAGEAEGWRPMMGIENFRLADGAMQFRSAGRDPALQSPAMEAEAQRWGSLLIRLKSSADDRGQVFWATTTMGINGSTTVSFEVKGDGAYHDYVVPLAAHRRWRGVITQLRIDPGNKPGTELAIDAIRLIAR